MAITISGENNNDRILAQDGVIDSISGFNIAGIITASSFTGDLTGDVTGNLTGNVNATSNLLLQIGGSEKFRVASSGQLGIGGANYGSAGQVLTSGGSGSAATCSTISSDSMSEGNTKAEVVDTGSDGHFKVTTEGSERLRITSDGKIGIGTASPTFAAGGGVHLQGGNQFTSYKVSAHTNTGVDFAQDAAGGAYVYNRDNADLILGTNNSQRVRINNSGAIGLGGANYGSSGQVLTSQGSGSAVTWSTISGTTINNNADNRIITGSGTANTLNGEANITYDATTSLLKLATASSTSTDAVLLHLVGGGTSDRGLKISTGRASGAGQNHAAAIYDAINSESSGYGSQHSLK